MQKPMTINLPIAAIERINQIIEKHRLFEDYEDFILHAITDMLEKYNYGGKENECNFKSRTN